MQFALPALIYTIHDTLIHIIFGNNTQYRFIDNCLVYNHSSVQQRFEKEIINAIEKLKEEDLTNIDTIIIDIRGNTGGDSRLNKLLIDFLEENKNKKLICLTDYRVFSSGRFVLKDLIDLGAITVGEEISTPMNCFGNSYWFEIDGYEFTVSRSYFHPLVEWGASSKEEFERGKNEDLLKPYIFKPSILICFEGDIGNGSGRSIPGFDLHDALCKLSPYLEKYGGHEMAVGLTLKKSKFKKFKEEFEKIAEEAKIEDIVSEIVVDKEITLKDITIENVNEIKKLEPFGEANKMPVFVYKNLKIDSIRALSEGKHLKLTLKDGNSIINAIGFNMGGYSEDYLLGDKVDVLGNLEINSFNGVDYIQINMKDIRKSY